MKRFYISRLMIPIIILLGAVSGANAQTNYTTPGGPYFYTVPAGITSVGVDMQGGNGGSSISSPGGKGARVQATLGGLTGGQVLIIYVGGKGSNDPGSSSASTGGVGGGGSGWYYGGGGGGASDIRTNNTGATYANATGLASRLVVAGAGGGGGYDCNVSNGEKGGDGGLVGGNGNYCSNAYYSYYCGTGATVGAGGANAGYYGGYGTLGVGGTYSGPSGVGGGGGGNWGGGGGAYGGGGGGSSFPASTTTIGSVVVSAVTNTTGYNTLTSSTAGNGIVTIYGPTVFATPSPLAFGSVTSGTTSVPPTYFTLTSAYMPASGSGASGIQVMPPANFNVSIDGTNWYSATGSTGLTGPLQVPYTAVGGVMTPVNVYVQFNPTATIPYSGNIAVYGTVLTNTVNVAVTGNGVNSCTGAPGGGLSSVTPATGGPFSVFTLGLSPIPTSGGLTYDWQSSPTLTGTYTDVPGGVLPTATIYGISATTYYRCIVTCAATGTSAIYAATGTTGVATLVGLASGCAANTASGGAAAGAYVSAGSAYPFVLIGASPTSISDPTSYGLGTGTTGNYNNETGTTYTCTLTPGNSYNATVGQPTGNYLSGQIWIDFNNDGTFASSESVGGFANYANSTTRPTFSIAIPSGVNPGVCRMRVITDYSANYAVGAQVLYPVYPQLPACPTTTTMQYGDIRDYQVTIGNPPCSGTPSPGIVAASALKGCTSLTPSLFSVGATAGPGITYLWQQNTGSGFGPAGSTSTYFAPTITSVSAPTVITYRMLVSCGASSATSPSLTVTVNPAPTTILGNTFVCTGLNTTLSSTPGPGTWTTSDATIASVVLSGGAGLVTGVSPGTAVITYAAPVTGCTTTTVVTVNQNPSAISGIPVVCRGATTSLGNSVTGGTWTIVPTFVATIDASSGLVTGGSVTSTSIATVTYTLPTTCKVTTLLTVNSLPTQFVVGGGGNVCSGTPSTYHVTLNSSTTGNSYQLFLNGSPVGLPVAGGPVPLDFGVQSAPGNYTVVDTNDLTKCYQSMLLTATINPVASPLPYTLRVSGSSSYCAGGAGVDLQTDGSQAGTYDSLFLNGVNTGYVFPGTGAAMDLSDWTVPGVYTIKASGTAGCTTNFFGSGTVIVNPLPTTFNVTGGGGYCIGGVGDTIGLDFSNTGIRYDLINGTTTAGTLTGTGRSLNYGLYTTAGTYSIVATNTTTGCTATMSGIARVFTSPLPNIYTLSGDSSYCAGGGGRHIQMYGSDLGTNYQLFLGSAPVGGSVAGTSSTLDFGAHTATGTYTVVATNGTNCTANMSGSSHITTNSLPTPQVVSGGGSYCAGGTGRHIILISSAVGTTYELYLGGTTPIGSSITGTGGSLDFGLDTTAGAYTIVATNGNGCTANMTGTAIIAVNPLPAQFNVTGTGNYCSGTAGLDVQLDFSSTGVNYQLVKDGTPTSSVLAGVGGALDFGTLTSGTYTVVATNPSTTCTNGMNGSAVIGINPLPVNHLVTGGGSLCAGDTGRVVGLNGSDAGINYQLYNGISTVGSLVAGTGGILNFGLQTAAGSYTILAKDAFTGCQHTMAGTATVVVNPLPNNFYLTGGGIFCTGTSGVHVGLNSSNTGIRYQLYNSGTSTGAGVTGTGLALDFGLQNASGTYTVVATNATTGCTANMAGSSIVAANPLPVVYTVSGGGAYCAGSTGLDVSLSGSDAGINYQLVRGSSSVGSAVSGSGGSIDFGTLTTAGTYTVVASDATTGCVSNMAASASILINPLPVVSTVSGGGSYCATGTGVHIFLGVSSNGVNYQLFNGVTGLSTMAGTGGSLDFGLTTTAGTYTIEATNPLTHCSAGMTGSATVAINPLPDAHTVTGGGGYCTGGAGVHIGLDGSDAGIRYQLYNGTTGTGAPVTGTGTSIDLGGYTAVGAYTVKATNITTGCTSNMAGSTSVAIVAPPTAYSITGGGNYCATGLGVHVGLATSDAGVNYQLYKSGTPIGVYASGTGGPLDFGLEIAPGLYTATANNPSSGCNSNMTGSTTIAIIPVVLPHVTLSSSNGGSIVCTGQSVTFNASPINGGTAPTYQWFVNGVNAGIGAAYTYLPNTGDVVTALMTSNAQCAIPDTGSLSMTMTVSPLEMPTVSIVANPGDVVCTGAPASFSASSLYGGTAPVMRWIKNGSFVSTGTTYTYTPANGDIIAFMLGSNYPCLLADTVYSNNISMSVTPGVVPVVGITANPGSHINAGQSVTFTASTTTGGAHPAYQWFVNSHMVAGATGTTFTTSALQNNDSVSCEVTGTCDLVGVNSIHMHVGTNVGVTQVSSGNSDVKLIPNPNKGDFSISGTIGTTDEEVSVDVVNMIGQVVYTGKVMTQNGSIDQHIQLSSNLANGMYILNLRAGSENTIFHFVIEK